MTKTVSAAERERMVRELVEQCGMTRQEAEFATAIELGEIPGDLIKIEDPDVANSEHAKSNERS